MQKACFLMTRLIRECTCIHEVKFAGIFSFLFNIDVAMCDPVHNVETIHGLC